MDWFKTRRQHTKELHMNMMNLCIWTSCIRTCKWAAYLIRTPLVGIPQAAYSHSRQVNRKKAIGRVDLGPQRVSRNQKASEWICKTSNWALLGKFDTVSLSLKIDYWSISYHGNAVGYRHVRAKEEWERNERWKNVGYLVIKANAYQ